MDRAFDVLNSKSKYGKGWKEALKPENIHQIREIYKEFSSYLLSLNDSNHQLLSASRRKTFVVGFICTFAAVLMLAEDLFNENVVCYLPTFRISQDFIETLFSKIRRMGGHNNNPTTQGFKAALRRLLAKQSISASSSANCIESDSSPGIFSLEWSKRAAPIPEQEPVLDETIIQQLNNLPSIQSNIHKDNIIRYIAGYVVRSLIGKVKCENCAQQLLADNITLFDDHQYGAMAMTSSHRLINVRNRGGLIFASEQVINILLRCEYLFTVFVDQKFMADQNAGGRLLALFQRSIHEEQPTCFFMHEDCDLTEGMMPRHHQLTRDLASKYIDIRLKHFSRLFNRLIIEKANGSDRNRLNRLIIFKHQ